MSFFFKGCRNRDSMRPLPSLWPSLSCTLAQTVSFLTGSQTILFLKKELRTPPIFILHLACHQLLKSRLLFLQSQELKRKYFICCYQQTIEKSSSTYKYCWILWHSHRCTHTLTLRSAIQYKSTALASIYYRYQLSARFHTLQLSAIHNYEPHEDNLTV